MEKSEMKDKIIEELKTNEEYYKVKYNGTVETNKKNEMLLKHYEEMIQNLSCPKSSYNPDPITSKFAIHFYEQLGNKCSIKDLYTSYKKLPGFSIISNEEFTNIIINKYKLKIVNGFIENHNFIIKI